MLVGIIYFRYSTLSRGKKKKKDKKDVELFHSEMNRALLRLYNSVHEHWVSWKGEEVQAQEVKVLSANFADV